MPLELADLVPNLLRETTPPGGDLYPDATDDQLVGYLQDGFWEARLDGLLTSWTESEGDVTPVATGGDEIPRDFQQIIIMYGGVKLVRTALLNTNTLFKAVAGPVSFETQNSPMILSQLLKELQDRRERLLFRLQDAGLINVAYIDGVAARSWSLALGGTGWTGPLDAGGYWGGAWW